MENDIARTQIVSDRAHVWFRLDCFNHGLLVLLVLLVCQIDVTLTGAIFGSFLNYSDSYVCADIRLDD